VLDPRLRVVLCNPAFERIFGQRTGDPCHVAFKEQDQPCADCPALEVFSDGVSRESEEQGVTPEGRLVTYRARAVPILGQDGDVEYVVQMALDVSRLRELERGLSQAERLASVGLTLAGLAHTIKNILAGLEGGIYVVNSGLEHDDMQRLRGGWGMVEKYIAQVASLVKNLLRYARAEEPVREEVEPGALVRDVLELFESKAALVSVELVAEVEPSLESMELDREAMHASLANLLSNALDACVWDPDLDKQHRIVVSASALPGGGVAFAVADNGTGISEENQQRVLQAFFTTKGIRGTGLGLLLTRKTVEAHGGNISFCSTPGQGTTFRIELPGSAPTAAAGDGRLAS
jgi:signal transduction histidine kinase